LTLEHPDKKAFSRVCYSCSKEKFGNPKAYRSNVGRALLETIKTEHKPLLLSLVNGFNDDFVPLYVKGLLPEPLTSLFHKDNQEIPFQDLLNASVAFYDIVSLTPEQVHMVELKTREQSKCKLWYLCRDFSNPL